MNVINPLVYFPKVLPLLLVKTSIFLNMFFSVSLGLMPLTVPGTLNVL